MIRINFLSFENGWYPDDREYGIYVLRHLDDRVLYVGMSMDNIWNRWFFGSHAHLIMNIYGERFGSSGVGKYILDHVPESNDYMIELWEPDECYAFIGIEPPKINYIRRYTELAEIAMIKALHPCLNIMHNS